MNKKRKVSFRVTRKFYDQYASGEKKMELRKASSYWWKRLLLKPPDVAVIHSPGQQTLQFHVLGRPYLEYAAIALKRSLTESEQKAIGESKICIITEIGERIGEEITNFRCPKCGSWRTMYCRPPLIIFRCRCKYTEVKLRT